jgi:Rad3-related DNA helicase
MLIQATTIAFAPNGPVQRIKGQHRVLQREAAINLANYIENETSDDPKREVKVWMQQQRAGIGKTTVVLVVLGLLKLLHGRGSMIATFTKMMRLAYLQEVATANLILEQTLKEIDQERLYRPLVIDEYLSATAYLSPTKMAEARRQIADGRLIPTQELNDLIDYFFDGDKEDEPRDDIPNFREYLSSGKKLPPGTDQLRWCMYSADKHHPLMQAIVETNTDARDADILLCTYAMLMMSNKSRGTVLGNRFDEDKRDGPRSGLIIGDEAEKLPMVAYDQNTTGTSLNEILDTLEEFAASYASASRLTKRAIIAAMTPLNEGVKALEKWLADHTLERPHNVTSSKGSVAELMPYWQETFTKIDAGLGDLQDIAVGKLSDEDRDPLIADRIRVLRNDIRFLVTLDQRSFPVVQVDTFVDHEGKPDVWVHVNLGSGKLLINRMWRKHQSGDPYFTYSGVAFISATLRSIPPDDNYAYFKSGIGFDSVVDTSIELPALPTKRSREQWGGIGRIAFASRDTPRPTDEINKPSMLNMTFVQESAVRLNTLAMLQVDMDREKRMLVLFPSFILMKFVYDALIKINPALSSRILLRDRDANVADLMPKYAITDHGIFFGIDWEGVNYIDPAPPAGQAPRTLVNILVLARIPLAPRFFVRETRLSDHFGGVEGQRKGEGISLQELLIRAYWRMIQGIGRGIRRADDIIELLVILDPRFPIPNHVSQKGAVPVYGDRGAIFQRFLSVLDAFSIRKWSVIDTKGKITDIT